jgi:hypothetical protein
MAIQLIRPETNHVPQMARICFEAFAGISDAHRFPYDIPSIEVAAMIMGMLVSRPDFYGLAAVDSSEPLTILGFNFLQTSDAVGGVGPICVDPRRQAAGVGRLLMTEIVNWSLKNHGPMVRLLQDSFNMRSLSLYTSVGYTVQEAIVLMEVVPAKHADATVRPLTLADLDAADALCRSVYKVSRRNELAATIQHGPSMGCVPHGKFEGGRITASLIPGFFGYSVGASNEALLETAQQAARVSPPPLHRIMIPARNGDLFRAALKRGFKSIKVMNMMSIGPFDSPTGAWTPSVTY